MEKDSVPYELRDLKVLEKTLLSKRILFKKLVIMHGKGEFSKIKGTICNALFESADICNVLRRPANSKGLIAVKIKWDLKYRGYVYFESVRPFVIYQALDYLRSHNKFYKQISISNALLSNELLRFSEMDSVEKEIL